MEQARFRPLARGALGACVLTLVALVGCSADDASVAQAQCDEWSNRASLGRRAAQDAAGRSCTTAEDCTIVDQGVSCFADCGYPSAVATVALPALEAEVQSLEDDQCGRFERAGCPGPFAPPCVPPHGTPVLACRGGQCVLDLQPFD
jgi:hypothetical protein